MPYRLDYWLNRLFYDLHTDPSLAAQYRDNRAAVMERYPLAPHLVDALMSDDVAGVAPFTNGFLMRYYFIAIGMPEHLFLARLRAAGERAPERSHG